MTHPMIPGVFRAYMIATAVKGSTSRTDFRNVVSMAVRKSRLTGTRGNYALAQASLYKGIGAILEIHPECQLLSVGEHTVLEMGFRHSHIGGGFVKEKTHMTRTRQCRGWRGAVIQKTLDEHSTFVVRDLATCKHQTGPNVP